MGLIKFFLKVSREVCLRISAGSVFQRVGAVTQKLCCRGFALWCVGWRAGACLMRAASETGHRGAGGQTDIGR